MAEQLTDKERQAHNLADTFSTTILAEECQKGRCFATCYPLLIHLENNDIKTSIVTGNYKGNIHYWLSIDGTETIIDPTIKQFDETKPQVFVGTNLNGDYFGDKVDDYSSATYWSYRAFINSSIDDEHLLVPPNYDKSTALKILLKAATLIYVETEYMNLKKEFVLSEPAKVYLDQIDEILVTSKNEELINSLIPTLPKEFEYLLAKAQKKAGI